MKPNFFHKYIKNTSTRGMILTERIPTQCWQKNLRLLKEQENLHVTGFKKKRKRKRKSERNQEGSCTPWKGAGKEERFLYPGKPPHRGRLAGTERELQSLRGECSSQFVAARAEGEIHRWSVLLSCTPQPEMCNHGCRQFSWRL